MTLIAFCKHCNAPLGGGHFAGCPEREPVAEYEPSRIEIVEALKIFYGGLAFDSDSIAMMSRALKAAHAIRTKMGP